MRRIFLDMFSNLMNLLLVSRNRYRIIWFVNNHYHEAESNKRSMFIFFFIIKGLNQDEAEFNELCIYHVLAMFTLGETN